MGTGDWGLGTGERATAARRYSSLPAPSLQSPAPTIIRAMGEKATGELRVGVGHDTHRLAPGGPLRLGGIDIQHDCGLVGHSDADVLLHAVTDALLGATASGDIGELFPDTDPANRGRDSGEMLRAARDRVAAAGYEIVNLDCIVFAEQPKLTAYKEAIRRRIGELLSLPADRIGLKAKTGEGVDAVGRGEAISAQCIALVKSAV
jgi:2-C-methyl-D-erythritol 2,4-cyclodiphosphate synthase